MGRLILVRHGESELNRDGIFYGQLDPNLTEKGKSQAKNAREILQNKAEKIDYHKIYSSDLIRASETAKLLNYKELELVETAELRELNFGIFEGMKYDEILEKYPKEEVLWREDWQEYSYETGESVREVQERTVTFIEKNIEEKLAEEDQNILVVAHWGVINCILSHYLVGGLEGYWKFATDNCGISVINFKDKFPVLEGLNLI